MNSKINLKVTKKDAFATGRIQGMKEAFEEVLTFLEGYSQGLVGVHYLKTYIKNRLKALNVTNLNDAFKQKDLK